MRTSARDGFTAAAPSSTPLSGSAVVIYCEYVPVADLTVLRSRWRRYPGSPPASDGSPRCAPSPRPSRWGSGPDPSCRSPRGVSSCRVSPSSRLDKCHGGHRPSTEMSPMVNRLHDVMASIRLLHLHRMWSAVARMTAPVTSKPITSPQALGSRARRDVQTKTEGVFPRPSQSVRRNGRCGLRTRCRPTVGPSACRRRA